VTRSGPGPSAARPPAIDGAAAILVFGGLFGLTQLLVGDFVITGSLPAKVPILGVAFILNAASTVLGIAIRVGRYWLPALNLAGIFAILYLLAGGPRLNLVLGLAYAIAFAILLRDRRWFARMAGR
jgi:hypothetical protein